MEWLLHLPALAGAVIAALGAAALAIVPFVIVRLLFPREASDATTNLAANVGFRVGALHGLILALVFADVQSSYSDLRAVIVKEATAIGEVFDKLEHFGDQRSRELRGVVADYVRVVIDEEWPLLNRPALSPRAWQLYDELEISVLELPARTDKEESLRDQMSGHVDDVAEYRETRLFHGDSIIPGLFWYVAISGFVITTAIFFVFKLTPLHVLLLSTYGVYTGIVLYFILALSHPFLGPDAVTPRPFELLAEKASGEPLRIEGRAGHNQAQIEPD